MILRDQYKFSYNLDCCEFCPDGTDTLLVGGYQLDENSATRKGGVWVLKDSTKKINTNEVKEKLFLETPGIFETHWISSSLVGFAFADGSFAVYTLENQNLSRRHYIAINNDNEIPENKRSCLSFDFCMNKQNTAMFPQKYVVSDVNGCCHILTPNEAEVKITQSFKAHRYPYVDDGAEIWTVRFDKCTPNVFASGGEDCSFRFWDVRNLTKPEMQNMIHHQGGVCSIDFLEHNEQLFLTGSYDNTVPIYYPLV
eukprot:maker-scaffold_5-snap-gene-2.37-mRNA-1 protein AED:0.00 eAED:0.00 QI:162/1/1/1/0.66/0.75/4/442/253